MCADKRTSTGGGAFITTCKIERMPNGSLVGCAGNSEQARAMRRWYRAGAITADFPAVASGGDVEMLVVEQSGRILLWGTMPDSIEILDDNAALGDQVAARALMSIGMSAYDTVEIISRVSKDCGNGIDKLELVAPPGDVGIGVYAPAGFVYPSMGNRIFS